MATNGGIIGKSNKTSFGKNTITSKTSSGTVTTQPGTRIAKILIVAGGGAGGANQKAGGGGAGGLRNLEVNASGNIPVTIGAGGAPVATSGVNSSLVACGTTYFATGGGTGGPSPNFPGSERDGTPGGSGGGGQGVTACAPHVGGTGNAGGFNPVEGFPGGTAGAPGNSAGGGGASQAGGDFNPPSEPAGEGGNGLDVSPDYGNIGPTCSVFAGGGGGGTEGGCGAGGGPGGTGGGGAGKITRFDNGTPGTTNTGGGGGGGGQDATSGNGGPGRVIVKELSKASGVWSMQSQFQAQSQGTWPRFFTLYTMDYLVVAGGGAGGGTVGACQVGGGGGGAGGYRASAYGPSPLRGSSLSIENGDYAITVGGGGAGSASGPGSGLLGANGNPSTFSTITSTGGGKGGAEGSTNEGSTSGGSPGGSGGGGSYLGPGGSGNTPPSSPIPEGNDGGDPQYSSPASATAGGGGGGGATAVGANATPSAAGAGGAGAPNTILGPDTSYAGGGGGSVYNNNGTIGAGGAGGGGAGVKNNAPPANNGTANTGGGGGATGGKRPPGAGNTIAGGSGGSGIVIVRGPSSVTFSSNPGPAATMSTHPGGDKIAKFTASATLTVT